MTRILTGAEHHAAAADHYQQAARHHRLASKHYAERDYAHAAHQALIGYGYAQRAARHVDAATRYRFELRAAFRRAEREPADAAAAACAPAPASEEIPA